MSSFSLRRVADYTEAFLKLTGGKGSMKENELASFLRSIAYCSDVRQSRQVARELIEKYDFSCSGVLSIDDFLVAMESIEAQVKGLRKYIEQSLRYFARRKLEQGSERSLGLNDIQLFLRGLSPSDAHDVLLDLERDMQNLFSVPKDNHKDKRSVSKQSSRDDVSIASSNSNNNAANSAAASNLPEKAFGTVMPESNFVDVVLNRLCPKPKEEVLYETLQSHCTLPIHISSLSVRNLASFKRTKHRRQDNILEFAAVDPMFVVACGTAVAYTRPINDYNWREETSEVLTLNVTLPSIKNEDVALWVDEAEVLISVFDYQECGVSPWTEWIGTARRRLSWFINSARDSAPVACTIELENITPHSKHIVAPHVAFCFTLPQQLVQLWHSYRSKGGNPRALMLADSVRKGLSASVGEVSLASLANTPSTFDLFSYWKRRRGSLRVRFPRRQFQCLARDEYGSFQLLPAFVQELHSPELFEEGLSELERLSRLADAISGLDSGTFPCCDSAQTAYGHDFIMSPSQCIFGKRVTSLEAAVLMCGFFLGQGAKAYVCFTEMETPFVMTVHQPDEQFLRDLDIEEQKKLAEEAREEEERKSREKNAALSFIKRKFLLRTDQGPKYSCLKEKEEWKSDRKKCSIKFWNPHSGHWYLEHDPKAPKAVDLLFNHNNIWFNVQQSTLVMRTTWTNIETDRKYWEPFLTKPVRDIIGSLKRAYSPPDVSGYPPVTARSMTIESKILLSDLVDAISLYRQHKLFLPDTRFDPELSRVMQTELFRMKTQIERCNALAEPDAASLSRTLEPGNQIGIPNAIMRFAPANCVWNGNIFSFKSTTVQEIMIKLEEVGILNHSHPTVRYAVAAAVFPYPWGSSHVHVYIATLYEIEDL